MPRSATKPHARRTAGRLRRDITLALAIKVALLSAIYFLWFGPAHRPPSDAAATATAVAGAGAAAPEDSR